MAVTSTNNLRLGSTGDDVLELQKLLNSAGNYNLAEDGSFGEKTLAAVKDYQTNNGLDVDGIVGTNTWGKLTGGSTSSSSAATTTTPTTDTNSNTGFTYDAYQKSDAVAQAEALLQQQLAQRLGSYQSAWQTQLDDIINRIMNREDFSYNLNEDAMYQQLKDQYLLLGQQASMDAMGQAASLTGGYGSSYAQAVGQQAYQGYLQQLNDVVPELYGMALDQHNQEGQALYDQAALMAQMEDQDYGRYQDSLAAYYTELDRLTEDARYKGEQDYGKWADDRNFAYDQFTSDRAYDYQIQQDQLARDEAVAQLMASVGDYSLLGKLYGLTDEQVAQLKNATKGGSGGKGGGDPKYEDWSIEADKYWTPLLANATSLGAVEAIGDRMQAAGYNPSYIASIVDPYRAKYYEDNQKPTDVDKTVNIGELLNILDPKVGNMSGSVFDSVNTYLGLVKKKG